MSQPKEQPPNYGKDTSSNLNPDVKTGLKEDQPPAHGDEASAPAYRAPPRFDNPADERAALDEFAESHLYVQGGTQGTMAFSGYRGGGLNIDRFAGDPGNDLVIKERQEADDQRKKRKEEKKLKSEEIGERRGSFTDRVKRAFGGKDKDEGKAGGKGDLVQ